MKEYDLAKINANVEQMLLRAQEGLESTIEAYGLAVDAFSASEVEYRKARARVVQELKERKIGITLIPHLSAGEVADLKGASIKAEGEVKRLRMLVDAYIERINGIKYIGRRSDDLANKS